MSNKIHEYLSLERWQNYKEENGIDTNSYLYTIPDYRFERIFAEIQSLKAENEKLRKVLGDLVEDIETPSRLGVEAPPNPKWKALNEARQTLKELK